MQSLRLAVLITCFNRVETTLKGLGTLQSELARLDNIDVSIFLTDDASPDETGSVVLAAFPEVRVYNRTGTL